MKIIGVGRNYSEHAKELNNEVPDEPVIFLMPDTAILKDNQPFYHPDYSNDIHHEIEIVIKISKEGKNIQEQFAHKYFDEIGIGVDFTARDLQQKAKEKGLPWSISKGFNGSAPVSNFLPKTNFKLDNLEFYLLINNREVQRGNTSDMLFDFNKIITYVSRFFTLKKGDLIFTGTPKGVSKVEIGDRLEGFLKDEKLFDFEVR